MPKILIATGNTHKTQEFRQLLGSEWFVEDLSQHPELHSPEENGTTFAENAAIKALAASSILGEEWLVLADDSGLECDALSGQPGVYSARFAGPEATDADNRAKLIAELAARGVGHRQSNGRFRCTLVLARGQKVLGTFDGTVEGSLGTAEAGCGGFGYDPLFFPDGYEQTFGELPGSVKNELSHRGKAAAKLVNFLASL